MSSFIWFCWCSLCLLRQLQIQKVTWIHINSLLCFKTVLLDFVNFPNIIKLLYFGNWLYLYLYVNMTSYCGLRVLPRSPTGEISFHIMLTWRWKINQFPKHWCSNKPGEWTKPRILVLNNVLQQHQTTLNTACCTFHSYTRALLPIMFLSCLYSSWNSDSNKFPATPNRCSSSLLIQILSFIL